MGDFTFEMYESAVGELSPDDLRFFYYDVAEWSEINQLIELSNNELLDLALNLNIKLIHTINDIQSINCGEIKFKLYPNETYQTALIRHLRNSFSHFRIIYKDITYFYMEDYNGKECTMLGFVKCDDLHRLIYGIRDYHEKIISNNTMNQF